VASSAFQARTPRGPASSPDEERTLPHNLELERGVLGACLLYPGTFEAVAEDLIAAEFYRDAHQGIFRALGAVCASDRPIDLMAVQDELARTGVLEDIGGPSYLARLMDGVPRSLNVRAHVDLIKEKARHRQIIIQADRLKASAYAEQGDAVSAGLATLAAVVAPPDDTPRVIAPTVEAWPAPLSRAAYVGIFGQIVDAIAPQTEADPAGLFLQLVSMFGNVIGRTAHFRVEADVHYLNLFLALVGTSAKGRKGVSAGHSRRLFAPVDAVWTEQRQVSGLSSGEGLIHAVRDKIIKQQPIKHGGRVIDYEDVVDDPGVSDKRLYVEESELANTLKVMMREGNNLSAIVRNAWDGRTLRTLTKNSPLAATGPHVSITGSITKDEVRRYLDATESANGFGNRFLWVCVKRARLLPDGGAMVNLDGFAHRLRVLVVQAQAVGELRREPAASALWHQVYGALSAGRPGLLGSITGRAEAQTMRLACLYALGDGAVCVQRVHLEAALEVWRYCFESAAYIFGSALGDAKADRLLAALRAAGDKGLTRTEASKGIFQGNITSQELTQLFSLLGDAGLVTPPLLEVADGAGRPAERWRYQDAGGNYFVSSVGSLGSSAAASSGWEHV
jgi:hypothetical protein